VTGSVMSRLKSFREHIHNPDLTVVILRFCCTIIYLTIPRTTIRAANTGRISRGGCTALLLPVRLMFGVIGVDDK
jgi:hypothetical protein